MKRSLMVFAAISTFAIPALVPVATLAQERGDRGIDDRARAPQRDDGRARRAPDGANGGQMRMERPAPSRDERPRPERPRPEGGQRPDRPQVQPTRPDNRPQPGPDARPDRGQGQGQGRDRPDRGTWNSDGQNRPGRPDQGRPGRPDAGRPDAGRPDGGRPGGRPDGGRPDQNRPDRDRDRPGQNRPDRDRDRDRPGAGSPGRPGADWNRNRDRDRLRNDYRNRFDSRRWQQNWNRNNRPDWWRDDNRFRGWSGIRTGFYFAPGYGYYSVPRTYWGRSYFAGDFLPSIFWRYSVNDYRTYGLGYPPAGTRWVYVDNAIYLIDEHDGYIIDVIRDAWRW